MIYLEPRFILDDAILSREDGIVIYSYERIVELVSKRIYEDEHFYTQEERKEMANQYIETHIEYHREHFEGWPLIHKEEEGDGGCQK